ncbi:AAA domain-containing protein [Rothia nasimurium]|uniref:AAA domain-containing protein n=1 Tax=Rothia nasimurium TaxID=85336 RepID=UPI00214B3D54|nr:bifunctional RecB family nuclease/DEAD/DEAH box helicase [Rothia nasimurium]
MFLIDASPAAPPHSLELDPAGKTPVFSATDLITSAQCQFAFLYTLDQLLGRVPQLKRREDPQLQRAIALGQAHEARVLADLKERYGPWNEKDGRGVYEVEPPRHYSRVELEHKREETVAALRAGADVVFQASFFDGSFHGRADFLIKQKQGTYRVVDTKLARTARVPALLQLAAYADQLSHEGIKCDQLVSLVLGNGVESLHELATIAPVFDVKRQRLQNLLTSRRQAGTEPISWLSTPGEREPVSRCGRCDTCQQLAAKHRDMLLTAGLTARARQTIYERCGVQTIDELAALAGDRALPGLVRRYAKQAALQTGVAEPDGTIQLGGPAHTGGQGTGRGPEQESEQAQQVLSYQLLPRPALRALPRASGGDIFLDLRSDALWRDEKAKAPAQAWGLTYTLGTVHLPDEPGEEPTFTHLWAHSRAEEERLISDLMGLIHHQRQLYPGLRVYYFGGEVLTALQGLAVTHASGEAYLTDLLGDGVLVDLSETLRRSLRTNVGTSDVAALEPFMNQNLPEAPHIPATVYADLCLARAQGETERLATLERALAQSLYRMGLTLLNLRAWLLNLAGRSVNQELTTPAPLADINELMVLANRAEDESEAERTLQQFVQAVDAGGQHDERKQAVAMIATATGYHRRERRQFWWDHFNRLTAPLEDWEDTRDVLLLGRLTVVADWHRPDRARSLSRVLSGVARLAPGSSVTVGESGLFAMYQRPLPPFLEREARRQALTYAALHEGVLPLEAERAGAFNTEILELEEIPEHRAGQPYLVRVTLRESLRTFDREPAEPYHQLPLAITPGSPIPTRAQEQALAELALRTARSLPELPASAGTDLLQRLPPRLTGGGVLPRPEDFVETHGSLATVQAIYTAVSQLDRSYVAVQGPPGSGKTFVGSHVIGRLVADGWKVGIVAQSHAVVENMLSGCMLNGGVDPGQVAKGKGKSQTPNFPWREVTHHDVWRFLQEPGGRVFGGTAWDFAAESKFRYEGLDLLVIDEAGQYSLANTLAVARAAKNLLLLGDPAQLPQVTQGTHPHPVDESALGWLSAGRTVLPEKFGYFLAVTWRMHPQLCGPVSQLSYEGKLASAPAGAERQLQGWAPGVYLRELEHTGNSTRSPEEAAEVVAVARRLLGHSWVPHLSAPEQAAPLEPSDIIVVAAYNAQVETIREALYEAGLANADGGVRVGTVDKFQGQEAPVVILSMAASRAGDSPRGTDFLLSPNRLNVALSRGQWAAVIICSTRFTDFLPTSPETLTLLGSFIRLTRAALPFPQQPGAGVLPAHTTHMRGN